MDALGFDLYTQMLERTVAELRGEAVEDETSVTINLGVDVAIPDELISATWASGCALINVSLPRATTMHWQLREEIRDRYGRLPESVEQLFGYARLRLLAETVGILSIDKTSDGVAIKFSEKARRLRWKN